jgi:hypothetical protein
MIDFAHEMRVQAVAQTATTTPLLPAAVLLTAAVTIIGWYVTYAFSRRKEDRAHRIQQLVKYRQQQIEEFYGPLVSLIEQIKLAREVREDLLAALDPEPGRREQIRELFWEKYFLPLHAEMISLFRSKLYLVEGGQVPESFRMYFKHATVEICQRWVETEVGEDPELIPVPKWPREFFGDATQALERLTGEYHNNVSSLTGKSPRRKPLNRAI